MNIVGIDVGKKNLALCHLDVPNRQILRWDVIEASGSTAPDILAALNSVSFSGWFDPNTTVVIERQPLKNPTMTRIQQYLEMYCALHSVRCVLQDSKIKLMFAATTTWWPKDLAAEGEWTYTRRKKLAVATAKAFLADSTRGEHPLAAKFQGSKKKDDFADSLLHALAYSVHPTPSAKPAPTKKALVARQPTKKQADSGKLSPSNVKWLLRDTHTTDEVKTLIKTHALGKALARAIKKHFGSAERYFEELKGSPGPAPPNNAVPSSDGDLAPGLDANQPH